RPGGPGGVPARLILRRREPGRAPAPAAWEQARPTLIDSAQVPVNEYFLSNPGAVLGVMRAVHGAYRAGDLVVHPAGDTMSCLTQALDEIAQAAAERRLRWQPAPPPPARPSPR